MSRAAVKALVEGGQRFLVTCHRRPDADALGSAIGFASILRALGKHARVFSVDPPPRMLSFLDLSTVEVGPAPSDEEWDACFVMDAAAAPLVPAMPSSLKGPVVMLDHHAAHDGFGDVVLREIDACATAVVVLRLMSDFGMDVPPPDAIAPLYAAIVADTGGFRYPQTTAETHRLAAELLDAGAEPWTTAYHLFEGWSPARMKLLGAVIGSMTMALDGKVAVLRVTRALLDEVGADDEMVEGMVGYGRMLEGVEISALLWEMAGERRETKISLRASGGADVSKIALALGGGGHRAAAGAAVPEDLDATEQRVLALAQGVLTAMGS